MAFYQDQNRRDKEQKRRSAQMRGGFEDEGSRYSNAGPSRGGRKADNRFSDNRPSEGRFGGGFQGNPRGGSRGVGGQPSGYGPQGRSQGPRPQGDNRGPQGFAPRGQGPRDFAPRGQNPRPQGGQGFGPRPQGDNRGPQGFAPRGQGPRDFAPRGQNPRPQGDNRGPQGFAPRGQGPRDFAPRGQNPRPQGDNRGPQGFAPRGQGPRPQGGPRPYEARPYESRPPRHPEDERRDMKPPRPYRESRQITPPPPRSPRPPRPQEAYRPVPPPAYDAPSSLEAADAVPAENLLSGRNPIREALKSGRDIEKLLVARGELSGSAREIVQTAKERHIPVQEVDRARLDAITAGHQGMLAFASAYQYHTVEDMLALAKEKGQDPFLVLLDGITDPHNLGAIIRTAECAGAHGVIVQERRAVGLTPAAVKASAGAVEYLPVARVTNLTQTIAQLQKEKLWVYAADMEGEDYAQVDFSGPIALVIGAEGEGVSRLVLEACDRRVSLPLRGQLDSLNASVAAGILLYAAMKGR